MRQELAKAEAERLAAIAEEQRKAEEEVARVATEKAAETERASAAEVSAAELQQAVKAMEVLEVERAARESPQGSRTHGHCLLHTHTCSRYTRSRPPSSQRDLCAVHVSLARVCVCAWVCLCRGGGGPCGDARAQPGGGPLRRAALYHGAAEAGASPERQRVSLSLSPSHTRAHGLPLPLASTPLSPLSLSLSLHRVARAVCVGGGGGVGGDDREGARHR